MPFYDVAFSGHSGLVRRLAALVVGQALALAVGAVGLASSLTFPMPLPGPS
jgi:hypothetical protein